MSCAAGASSATGCGSCSRSSPVSDGVRRRAGTRSPRWMRPRAYLARPILGGRLRECAAVLAPASPPGADAILGRIDAQKLQSSMTLFLRAAPGEAVFADVLQRHYGGRPHAATDELLS